jgi:hypothetical protein
MSYRDVWSAAETLVDVLEGSPLVRRFQSALAFPDRRGPLQQQLHEILGAGGMLRSQPVLIADYLPAVVEQIPHIPGLDELSDHEGFDEFMADADSLGWFTKRAVEWLRSRLPNYPRLLVPHIEQESPQSDWYAFMGDGFPWSHAARQTGLQFEGPPNVPVDLAVDNERVADCLNRLWRALEATGPWEDFAAAGRGLSDADRVSLRKRRRVFRTNAEKAADDAGTLMIRDRAARRAALRDTVDQSDGSVREYYDAFERVDHLIDAVASVLSQLLAGWAPARLREGTVQTERRDGWWWCRISTADPRAALVHANGLVAVPQNSAGLSGVILMHELHAGFSREPDGSQTFSNSVEGPLLPESEELLM